MLDISPSIFRAYDIRGVVGKELNEAVVYAIGYALGSLVLKNGETSMIVGRDGRLSGPVLVNALSQGILASGCNVIDVGLVPTPVLYYATFILETRSGVMLTGSHNPADYNGLKMVINGQALAENEIQHIYHSIINNPSIQSVPILGKSRVVDLTEDYLQRITNDVRLKNRSVISAEAVEVSLTSERLEAGCRQSARDGAFGASSQCTSTASANTDRRLKVVIDCGNGVAGNIAPALFRRLGCDVIELFCEVDGRFPNHHPDPSQTENLQDLIGAVKENNADIGLAFDGDADRLGVVTNQGEIIWPDRQLILFAQSILAKQPNAKIIYDVKCTHYLDKIIRALGGDPIMWKTGHSLIKKKLMETQAAMAGEMSGHIFFNDRWYGFDDAMYAGARLLEILAQSEMDSATLFSLIPNSVNTPELKVYVTDKEKFALMQEIVSQANFSDAEVNTIDGLRVNFADGWGLIRPSNTTPCLVLRFEAETEGSLARIQQLFRDLLLSVKSDLALSF